MYVTVPVVNVVPLRYVRVPVTVVVRVNDPLAVDFGMVTRNCQPVRKPEPLMIGAGADANVAPPDSAITGALIVLPVLPTVPCCCGENGLLSVIVKLWLPPSACTPDVGDTVRGGLFRPGLAM